MVHMPVLQIFKTFIHMNKWVAYLSTLHWPPVSWSVLVGMPGIYQESARNLPDSYQEFVVPGLTQTDHFGGQDSYQILTRFLPDSSLFGQECKESPGIPGYKESGRNDRNLVGTEDL